MKITVEWLKKEKACEEGLGYIIRHFGKGAEVRDMVIKLAMDNHLDWAIWLIRRIDNGETILRKFAADAAEHVLPIFEKRYPEDKRPRAAIAAARQFAAGEITREQLRNAADAAAYAYAAGKREAALDARAAERKWQAEKLVEYFREETGK